MDAKVALEYVLAVTDAESVTGMISHEHHPNGDASGITQPPVLSLAIIDNAYFNKNETALKAVIPKLEKYLEVRPLSGLST